MKDGTAPYWFPALTLVIGAIGGFLADFLREGRTARTARKIEADAFERETLIALQDALSRIGRSALSIHQFDDRIYRQTGGWGRELTPEGADDAFIAAANDVTRYRVRVRADDLRADAGSYALWCVVAQTPASGEDDDDAAHDRAVDAKDRLSPMVAALNERIGERLRELL